MFKWNMRMWYDRVCLMIRLEKWWQTPIDAKRQTPSISSRKPMEPGEMRICEQQAIRNDKQD